MMKVQRILHRFSPISWAWLYFYHCRRQTCFFFSFYFLLFFFLTKNITPLFFLTYIKTINGKWRSDDVEQEKTESLFSILNLIYTRFMKAEATIYHQMATLINWLWIQIILCPSTIFRPRAVFWVSFWLILKLFFFWSLSFFVVYYKWYSTRQNIYILQNYISKSIKTKLEKQF